MGIYTRQSKCAPIRAEEGLLGVLSPPGSSVPYRELPTDQHIGGYPAGEQLEVIGVDPVALDSEGRCVVLEFPAFVLFGLYSPANSNGMRDDFRYGFLNALDFRIRNLIKLGKRVVVTGDLNNSRDLIDIAAAEENIRKEGLTRDEYVSTPNRRIFNQLLEGGNVVGERDSFREQPVMWDICRGFHEGREGMYTHWDTKLNARPGNYGSRIDYILCSLDMKSWFEDSNIQEGLMVSHACILSFISANLWKGSDHCPVYAILKDEILVEGQLTQLLDTVNPPGNFVDGERKKELSLKEYLPFSCRMLPEFDRRRNIRDMFARKPQPSAKLPLDSAITSNAENQISIEDESAKEEQPPTSAPSLLVDRQVDSFPSPSRSGLTQVSQLSGQKRRTSSGGTTSPVKRSKSNVGSSNGASNKKGQTSLKGFFKPKTTQTASIDDDTKNYLSRTASSTDCTPIASSIPSPSCLGQDSVTPSESPVKTIEDEDVIDQVASKETWDKLFTKRGAPKCDHGESCISYTTKKPGINCGRTFWLCPR